MLGHPVGETEVVASSSAQCCPSGLGLGSGQFNNTQQCLECQPNACSKRQGLQKPSKSNSLLCLC